jgi:hypothetical protein
MGSTPIASTIFYFMKKSILSFIILFLIPSHCSPLNLLQPNIGVSTSITFKENLLDAVKKIASFVVKNKAFHGAVIGSTTTLLADAIITSIFDKKTNALLSKAPEPKPKTSVPIIAAAAAYGAYLTTQRFTSFSELYLNNIVVGLALAIVYFVGSLILENIDDDITKCSLKNNLIGALKQFGLNVSSSLVSYAATKKLETLNY